MSEEVKRNSKHSGIKEVDLKRLILLLHKIERGVELLYYLMDNKRGGAFVVALLSATNLNLEGVIKDHKRNTDILFEIDKDEQLYAILCQDTEVDGGYYFMQRLIESIEKRGGEEVYCSELEVSNTDHPIQEIVFRLLNMYRRTKKEKSSGKISFHHLN